MLKTASEPVFVASIVTKSKILVPNTAIEVSGDQTFLDLFTNLKREAFNPPKKLTELQICPNGNN